MVVGPLPPGEANNKWSTWDTAFEFNERKFLSIRRWYRIEVDITIPDPDDKAHLPPVRQIAFSDIIMRCGVFLPLLPYFKRIITYYGIAPF